MNSAKHNIQQASEMISVGNVAEAIELLQSELNWESRSAWEIRSIVRFLCATLDFNQRITDAIEIMKQLDRLHLAEASDLFFLWKSCHRTSRSDEALEYLQKCRQLCKSENNKEIKALLDSDSS